MKTTRRRATTKTTTSASRSLSLRGHVVLLLVAVLTGCTMMVSGGELRGMTLQRKRQGNTQRQLKRAQFALRRRLTELENDDNNNNDETEQDNFVVDTPRYEHSLETEFEKLKALHLVATKSKQYLQKHVLRKALEETESLLDPAFDPESEGPFVVEDVMKEYNDNNNNKKDSRSSHRALGRDNYFNRERRILFYGDNVVSGISSALGRFPPGPMLEERLRELGYNAKVSSVSVTNWSVRWMRSNARRDRVGILENIRRTSPELVILSAGYFDVLRRETNVDLVISFFQTIATLVLREFGVRWLIILPVPQWKFTDEDPEREAFRVALNGNLTEAFIDNKRVDVQPLAFLYQSFGPDQADPYYARNKAYFSELGYNALANQTVNSVDFYFEQPYRILLYGDSITLGNVRDGAHAPYINALRTKLQKAYGWEDVSITLRAFPGWQAIPSFDGIETHRLGLVAMLNFGILSLMPVDCLILLLGTNDLKFNIDWNPVHTSLIGHHNFAYREQVKYSIAIEVPPNRHIDPHVPHLYNQLQDANTTILNAHQRQLKDTRLTWVNWPFPYDVTSEEYPYDVWWSDGFHPTPMGYDVVGEHLAPFVWNILEGQQHILCFGDYFTTGRSSGTNRLYPYAFFLERSLRADAGTGREVVVSHVGNRGMTAVQLAEKSQEGGDRYGLSEQLKDSVGIDIVIIWAGMYDIRDGATDAGAVANAILELNTIALNYEHVKHTILVGIPPSDATETDAMKGFLRSDINRILSGSASDETTYFEFPFERYDSSQQEWGHDGLFLTRQGHINFADALFPVVESIMAGLTTAMPTCTPSAAPSSITEMPTTAADGDVA